MTYSTPHEDFWAGDFGSDYASRNDNPSLLASNTAMFSRVLARTHDVHSVVEFGANIGLNLRAISSLIPNAELSGVELNATAFAVLETIPNITAYKQSLLDFNALKTFDLTLSKGVLIHISPDRLDAAYETLYKHSHRYICVAEYYSSNPVAVSYRGHADRMYKRDFAGEIMQRYRDLVLVDYGFVYRNDPVSPLDDITWFLLERR